MQDLFEGISKKSSEAFEKAYARLNPSQKLAVDTIDGPVMVIAGPGTGKTQILSIRIGHILLETDTDPKSILCLTFTEAGASEMRRRLFDFIGPTAFDVGIYTFHAFCNSIIRDHAESFKLFGEFELADDLELREIIADIVSEIKPGEALFNYKNNYESLVENLLNLFNQIKKENWIPSELIQSLKKDLINAKTDPEYLYRRKTGKYNVGDLKEDTYNDLVRKTNRTIHALQLFEKYNKALFSNQRYDYNDMIQWVLHKFQTNDNFLSIFQEKYLYILVDEYQDTNGSQNEVLYALTNYDDRPNIFAVGDDDQAIFRFQGAKISNMTEFKKRLDPKIIMLTDNYRSNQGILNLAGASIINNKERLVYTQENLSKELLAKGDYKNENHLPILSQYQSKQAEITDICERIEKLILNRVKPSEIAVLFKKNNESEPYIRTLESKKIPYQVSRRLNILDEPFIKQIIFLLDTILHEIEHPLQSLPFIFEILHFPFLNIPLLDIGILAAYRAKLFQDDEPNIDKHNQKFYHLLFDENELKLLNLNDSEKCFQFGLALRQLIQAKNQYTLQVWFERFLHEFGILKFVLLSDNRTFLLQILYRFFDFIKTESVKKPDISLSEFVHRVKLMQQYNVTLEIQEILGNKDGVALSTLHSAKGLEYEHVFMVGLDEKSSKIRHRTVFKLPTTIMEEKETKEDLRRLFYVGLTRAKSKLQLSYASDEKGKQKNNASAFVLEISAGGHLETILAHPSEEQMIEHLIHDMRYVQKEFSLVNDPYIDEFLSSYSLNPTGLNKYLECPVQFYYENVLRIPSARTPAMGFGKAMHRALELYLKIDGFKKPLDDSKLIHYFDTAMKKLKSHFTEKEFESYSSEAYRSLPDFLKTHWGKWSSKKQMQFEIKISNILSNQVPVSGMIDRLDFSENGLEVIDYKTGSTTNINKYTHAPSDKEPLGSSYWRQMVFYNILLDSKKEYSHYNSHYIFYYLIKDEYNKFHDKEIHVSPDDKEKLIKLIGETYGKIKNKIFTPGCGLQTCRWCQYINSGSMGITISNEEEYIDED